VTRPGAIADAGEAEVAGATVRCHDPVRGESAHRLILWIAGPGAFIVRSIGTV